MERFRRAALIFAIPMAAIAISAQAGEVQPMLIVGSSPGGLTVMNGSNGVLRIATTIGIERRAERGWLPVKSEFNAVAICTGRELPAFVQLQPHSSLVVQPWTGYSCSSQCPASCRHNLYLGSGPFRYVVTMLPSGMRVTSPVFQMLPHPRD